MGDLSQEPPVVQSSGRKSPPVVLVKLFGFVVTLEEVVGISPVVLLLGFVLGQSSEVSGVEKIAPRVQKRGKGLLSCRAAKPRRGLEREGQNQEGGARCQEEERLEWLDGSRDPPLPPPVPSWAVGGLSRELGVCTPGCIWPRGGSSHQYHSALINPGLFLIPSVVWLLCWNSLPKEGFLGGVKASFGRLGSSGGVWGKHRPPVPPPQNPPTPPHPPLGVPLQRFHPPMNV